MPLTFVLVSNLNVLKHREDHLFITGLIVFDQHYQAVMIKAILQISQSIIADTTGCYISHCAVTVFPQFRIPFAAPFYQVFRIKRPCKSWRVENRYYLSAKNCRISINSSFCKLNYLIILQAADTHLQEVHLLKAGIRLKSLNYFRSGKRVPFYGKPAG